MVRARPRLLLVDDGESYARLIAERMPEVELLEPIPGQRRLPDGPSALAYLARHVSDVDVVLLDMHFDVPEERLLALGEGDSLRRRKRFQGAAILREIRRLHPGLPVVLLTSLADLSPVDASGELSGQSLTYFLEADDLDSLRIRVNVAVRDAAIGADDDELLWGYGSAIRTVRSRLAVLARGRLPIIIEGETGTGKSFLAQRFVHAQSGRRGPFITLDLATVPEGLASAHLFGAKRGAYTGAVTDRPGAFHLAHRGTLFLDEVQNIPIEVQKQLLVVLQEGRVRPLGGGQEDAVDVRVIAATNAPLAEAVAAGHFRHDLYMRLSPSTRVVLPPLRERPEDLPFLAHRLVSAASREQDIAPLVEEVELGLGVPAGGPVSLVIGSRGAPAAGLALAVPQPGWELLQAHHWPGNLRELAMLLRNLLSFTLVAAVDALRSGVTVKSRRLQADTGLIAELIAAGRIPAPTGAPSEGSLHSADGDRTCLVSITAADKLSSVASDLERQVLLGLFQRSGGSFPRMAEVLLGDPGRHRAVRLRFNQLGLKVRALRTR